MDKLDFNIILSLNSNGRKSFRHIAKELKVSLSTISNRVKRLEEEGIIERYIPVINKEKIDITGDWDSLIIAHFKDRRELNNFIKKILSMDYVERSNTQLVLNIVKNEKRLLI